MVDTSGFTPTNRIFLSNLVFHAVASYIFYDRLKIPLLIYIDEFQTVASNLIRDILEFGRGEKVGFTLAHHDFSEIKDKNIIKSVIAGVQNMAIFRCGEEEDRTFSDIFKLKKADLRQLKDYEAWVRLGTDNILIETFEPLMTDLPEINLPGSTKVNFLRNQWITSQGVL